MFKIVCAIVIFSFSFSAIEVFTTVLPLSDFVEKVGGKHVRVTNLIPSGANPHSYEPSPKQLKQLSKSNLLVIVGADFQFETIWLPKILKLNSQLKVCNTSVGIEKIEMIKHKHPENEVENHHHSNIDPHSWLSISNAIYMVTQIRDALINLDPSNKEEYLNNTVRYIKELSLLQSDLKELRASSKRRSFLVFHPAWGYFAKEFDLEQHSIEINGKEPSPKKLMEIIKSAREEQIDTIFIEPQFNKKAAKTIARELSANVVELNPLAKDYINNMRKVGLVLFGAK